MAARGDGCAERKRNSDDCSGSPKGAGHKPLDSSSEPYQRLRVSRYMQARMLLVAGFVGFLCFGRAQHLPRPFGPVSAGEADRILAQLEARKRMMTARFDDLPEFIRAVLIADDKRLIALLAD